MRKLLHTSWIVLLLLLALPLGALYYLTCTDAGLRTLASHLSRRLGPVTLDIRGVSGALASGAHIDHIVVDHRRALEATAPPCRSRCCRSPGRGCACVRPPRPCASRCGAAEAAEHVEAAPPRDAGRGR
jgi:hypothetical protein